MQKLGGVLRVLIVAALALLVLESSALAADTMADWTGENTNASNDTFNVVTTNNNYGLLSSTSVGGTIQSKINFSAEGFVNNNEQHVYFSDPTLSSTLDFTTPLHMEGTITFNSPNATEPNICFCWYASSGTDHRIGLGISNLSVTQNPPDGAVADKLRIDLGYATNPPSGSNRFYNVSADGTLTQSPTNSLLPNGTYPFTFDYTPGPAGMAGGSVSATVGSFFYTRTPLENQPWDNDFFTFDRFGIVQRTTGSVTNNPTATYSVMFSGVTYTGGTAAPDPTGDFNGDGVVNTADYVMWRKTDATPLGYNAWVKIFGEVIPVPGGGGGVPEPSALILCLGGGIALASMRRRSFQRSLCGP